MTYLHDNRMDFQQLVIATGKDSGVSLPIIEKDYYVTMFLREIAKIDLNIVFKGGTSLSKGYGLIKRFSEDIDLNYDNGYAKPSVSMRRNMKNAILEAGDRIGLVLDDGDRDTIPYKQDYLVYNFSYPAEFSSPLLRPVIQVETSVRSPSYPLNTCLVGSEIQQYLEKIDDRESLESYGLGKFPIKTQSIERTFADKLFAVADYYLEDMADRDSRHIYDLYCLRPYVTINKKYITFLEKIRELRKSQPNNPSARSRYLLTDILKAAIRTDFYEQDYEKYTIPLLFQPVGYEEAINRLSETVAELEQARGMNLSHDIGYDDDAEH